MNWWREVVETWAGGERRWRLEQVARCGGVLSWSCEVVEV